MLAQNAPLRAQEPVTLKIVGGLGGVRQYTSFEQPFWEREIAEISGGRIRANVHPFDRSGIRGQDMLQLMKMGVVPFGNAPLSIAASDAPALQAVDLPGMNADFATLRRSIEAYRPKIKAILREVYDVELLAIYSYPAQVLFCARPFQGLQDIAGFRVRASSLGQSELMTALGALPVVTPFSETVAAVSRKSVDCAITGILSGHEIGLGEVTTHVHAKAINWGVSVFGANRTAWDNLPEDVRETLSAGVRSLEQRILKAAADDTAHGFACSKGLQECRIPKTGRQSVVAESGPEDEIHLRRLEEMILPKWLERCGADCEQLVNEGLLVMRSAQTSDAILPASERRRSGD